MDLAQAERFLHLLDAEAAVFCFQTFTDAKDRPRPDPLAAVMTGSFAEVAPRLEALNQRGAGIFVTVNATDGRGRKKTNITRVRALWQEADRGDEPHLPVEPHLEVESSPGKFHRYLRVDGLPLEEFESAQQLMVYAFGSDPAAKDRARVLRLPGFYHLKDPSRPHRVRLVHESGKPPTPWDELQPALLPVVSRLPDWNGNLPATRDWPGNRDEITSALATLDPNMDYEAWLEVGMALHHEAGAGPEALELWDSWSQGSPKYSEGVCADKWRSFDLNREDGVTLRTLFARARREGWAGLAKDKVRGFAELLVEAKGLNRDSEPSAVQAIIMAAALLPALDKKRIHQAVKNSTGYALSDLREAESVASGRGAEVDQLTLAKAIRDAVGAENLIGQDAGVWLYQPECGIWRELTPREEQQLVQRHLEDAKVQGQVAAVSSGLVKGVTDLFKSEVHREGHTWEQGFDEAVSTPGGVLVLDDRWDWVLRPHRREDYRTVQIPIQWDPQAEAPRFEQFLAEIFAPDDDAKDKARAILEMMGYSLMAHTRHEKFIILVGEGSNGKSVLLAVLERLLGTKNVAGVQPSQFDRSFQRAHLHLKLANIVTEMRQGEVIADAELKGITSGETSTVERKFRDPFNLRPYATCWFGTNHLPHTRDFSDALFRRALVVRFNRRFDPNRDANPRLKDQLFEELPGILRRSLYAYADALVFGGFTEPRSCQEAKQAWRMEADQAAQFVEDACCEDGEIGSKALYRQYSYWAENQGIRQKLSQKSFSDRMVRLGYTKVRRNQGNVFQNLSLKPYTPD